MDFAPFVMAHTPLKMTIEQARQEINYAWSSSYSPKRNAEAIASISHSALQYQIGHLVARFFFRGIYFPQMNKRAWLKLVIENRRTILSLSKASLKAYRSHRKNKRQVDGEPAAVMNQRAA
jgi:hypothetical protein